MTAGKRIWIGRIYLGCAWGGPVEWGFQCRRGSAPGSAMITLSIYRAAFGIGVH